MYAEKLTKRNEKQKCGSFFSLYYPVNVDAKASVKIPNRVSVSINERLGRVSKYSRKICRHEKNIRRCAMYF